MASLTIRNLDEKTKQALRERAARNGNSMEEEVRIVLANLGNSAATHTSQAQTGLLAGLLDDFSPDVRTGDARSKILLIITGGIAAYKCLELIRRLQGRNIDISVVMSEAACKFLTPLSVEALTHNRVYTELFSREDEHDIGHIRLAREADLIVVAPASADFMAKIANGIANDLPSTICLAANTPILLAPAMNPAMWQNPATMRNCDTLNNDGKIFVGPNIGEMAERGEAGPGRMAEPDQILNAIIAQLEGGAKPLTGLHAIITAGPTHEPIDPVRYIANRSSGKQGYAIAAALANAGAKVSLVSGPVNLSTPSGVDRINVETAIEMYDAVEACLPADIAVMVAAVADWRSATFSSQKIKKKPGADIAKSLNLIQNPDILKTISHHKLRPRLVIGFAAETEKLLKHAKEKLLRKGADWIIANDISPENSVMGGDENTVKIVRKNAVEDLPLADKFEIGEQIVERIARHFKSEIVEV